jgi:type IV pilus assembly protein PilX
MHSIVHKRPGRSQQQGVVLIVTLVLLVIITLIAVAGASDISLQSKMARNSQFSLNAYNQAFSEINAQVGVMKENQAMLIEAANNDSYALAAEDLVMSVPEYEQSAELSFLGEGDAIIYGEKLGGGNPYRFELDSEATVANTGAKSDQTQGLIYHGPSL